MSYTKIFKTVILKLNDGKILHFSREGCNNDDAGRRDDEFILTVYNNESDFMNYALKFRNNSQPIKSGGAFDLMINGRRASWYDFGDHLIRMYGRADNENDFTTKRPRFFGKAVKSIILTDTGEEIAPENFNFFELLKRFGGSFYCSYRYNYINTISELKQAINDGADISAYQFRI